MNNEIVMQITSLLEGVDKADHGKLVTSGEAFDLITQHAKTIGLETKGVINLDFTGQVDGFNMKSTPIVIDNDAKHSTIMITQDSDHVVLSRTQAQSLIESLKKAIGVN